MTMKQTEDGALREAVIGIFGREASCALRSQHRAEVQTMIDAESWM